MMKQILFVIGIIMMTFFFSCVNKNIDAMSSIERWQDKQILFPENPVFTCCLKDTVDYQFLPSEYKVLVYADSSGCISCKLQLHKWKELVDYTDSISEKNIPFLFFIHPRDKIEIKYLLQGYEFDIPVCIDLEDELKRLNNFKPDSILQVFLLDNNNRVLVYGNPLDDSEIKRAFFKHSTGEDHFIKTDLRTSAEVTKSELDFGLIDKAEVVKGLVGIKNTGNNPLYIVHVRTSCGCTVAKYDRFPVNTGDTIWMEIIRTPKGVGPFYEMVTIEFNSENNKPIRVRVRGNAK